MHDITVSTHNDRPIWEKTGTGKNAHPPVLGIDISKEDTLHTLTKPRGKDGTENLAYDTHDIS